MKDVCVKWTGSKRLQANNIIQHFPKVIKTYYEPFFGGGAMFYKLMNSNIQVENIVCSDLNEHLMGIWQIVKNDPQNLSDHYLKEWTILNTTSVDYYLEVRKRFNLEKSPYDFFFLLRTCRNGLVRFNSKGEFNVCFHYGRKGMTPDKIDETIKHWSNLLKKVTLLKQDYTLIKSERGDFVYCDPPYSHSMPETIYGHNSFNYKQMYEWLRSQEGSYALSLDGTQGDEDVSILVDEDLYNEKYLIDGGTNKLNQDISNRDRIYDSLYIKLKCEV